jgi:hypothetical protein
MSGSAPPQEGVGPMPTEDARDSNASEYLEDIGNNDDSELGSLSPLSEDVSFMASEEHEDFRKEL